MSARGPAVNPCGSCPYRRDVPSGLWAAEEYEKLSPYDNPTGDQPPTVFLCHQQNGRMCAGWVGCHSMDESLGLRLALSFGTISEEDFDAAVDYVSPVPLFESGEQAEEHGLAELYTPGSSARRQIEKLRKRQERSK